MKLLSRLILICAVAVFLIAGAGGRVTADTTDSTTYGSGNFGDCNYGSCTITLTSDGATDVDVVPTADGRCSVQSDTASVLTDSSSGYILTMTTSTTDNGMSGSGGDINASSATAASPTTLPMNTWGYRVDGLSGFGTGPTSSQASGSVPSVTFAGVPPSNGTPTAVAASSGPANPAEETTVWYGLCADDSVVSGSYSVSVLYTAITN